MDILKLWLINWMQLSLQVNTHSLDVVKQVGKLGM